MNKQTFYRPWGSFLAYGTRERANWCKQLVFSKHDIVVSFLAPAPIAIALEHCFLCYEKKVASYWCKAVYLSASKVPAAAAKCQPLVDKISFIDCRHLATLDLGIPQPAHKLLNHYHHRSSMTPTHDHRTTTVTNGHHNPQPSLTTHNQPGMPQHHKNNAAMPHHQLWQENECLQHQRDNKDSDNVVCQPRCATSSQMATTYAIITVHSRQPQPT
ncbi:uncharacterized protein LACBIDRAFT_335914 [Laccaria bicolor S238N-H82]|uniref:Predicted protein n=1 Tax=Laccaria bicolor (strain S238N-H82 / ATCC MYA-4686) TaxID=486041 RepID=B0E3T7_LACBS|nr:uncharacterized protein LACBIDRAFT_335914 [Laccaria bicolor S238N-H82]EDQ98492.1 predicted protein [Laccaria bicolor S238N-H82]|eukprot:XP_001890855.1 predicted protein [Laccaria bicolor S238N-H82]